MTDKTATQREYQSEDMNAKIGIPKRYVDKTLDNYGCLDVGDNKANAHKTALSYVKDWKNAYKTGRSLLFVGRPGTGKTHLAIGIARVIAQEYSANVRYASLLETIERIKDAWRLKDDVLASDIIEDLLYADLLILDDMAMTLQTDANHRDIFFEIVNYRYKNIKPTILISSATPSETRYFVGESVWDRLRENGGSIVTFDWQSYRGTM